MKIQSDIHAELFLRSTVQCNKITLINSAATMVLSPSDRRIAAIFPPGAGFQVWYSTEQTGMTNGGLTILNGFAPIHLSLSTHYGALRQAWYCFQGSGADAAHMVYEVISDRPVHELLRSLL